VSAVRTLQVDIYNTIIKDSPRFVKGFGGFFAGVHEKFEKFERLERFEGLERLPHLPLSLIS
jgi:hypothetical protein